LYPILFNWEFIKSIILLNPFFQLALPARGILNKEGPGKSTALLSAFPNGLSAPLSAFRPNVTVMLSATMLR
jgi:hypothetical protein